MGFFLIYGSNFAIFLEKKLLTIIRHNLWGLVFLCFFFLLDIAAKFLIDSCEFSFNFKYLLNSFKIFKCFFFQFGFQILQLLGNKSHNLWRWVLFHFLNYFGILSKFRINSCDVYCNFQYFKNSLNFLCFYRIWSNSSSSWNN
jgi:hypothetical protein